MPLKLQKFSSFKGKINRFSNYPINDFTLMIPEPNTQFGGGQHPLDNCKLIRGYLGQPFSDRIRVDRRFCHGPSAASATAFGWRFDAGRLAKKLKRIS
jgi:hypothetical protein